MKRIARNPERFEPLSLFTTLGLTKGYKLGDAESIEQFSRTIRESLEASQQSESVLHGKRVEAMFAHVAGALGGCKIVKSEDSGEVFTDDEQLRIPDYRITLADRTQFLVEVKNCHIDSFDKFFLLRTRYFDALERYADINSVPLKIAVYFSRLNRWCLLSKEAFQERDGSLRSTFVNALAKNEMHILGDCTLATLPELKLELMADPAEAQPIDGDGFANITFRTSKIFCAGKEVTDPFEQQIAFQLMRLGEWPDESDAVIDQGKLLGVVVTARPESNPPDGQPCSTIGQLSSLVSAAYSEFTVFERQPVALDAPVNPEALSLRLPRDYKGIDLPIWRFITKPNWQFKDPKMA